MALYSAYLVETNRVLDFHASGADVAQDLVDADLVDDAHAFARQAQLHEALFAFHPETMRVQVRVETALGAVFRVGNVVADQRGFAGNHTDSGHGEPRRAIQYGPEKQAEKKRRDLYQKTPK